MEEPARPRSGLWLVGLLIFLALGAGSWLWYRGKASERTGVALASVRHHTYVQDGRGNTRAEHIAGVTIMNPDAPKGTVVNERRITVKDAKVIELVGPGSFTIGPREQHTLLVRYVRKPGRRRIQVGDVVTVVGQVRPMPNLVAARRLFGLGTFEGSRLGSTKYYIEADDVSR